MSVNTTPKREEIDPRYTWDLESLYANDNEWEADFDAASKGLDQLEGLAGTLTQSGDQLLKALEIYLALSREVENLYVYSHLKNDQDQTNSQYQTMNAKAMQLYALLSEKSAFFQPELMTLEEADLEKFYQASPELEAYRHFLDNSMRFKSHTLSAEQELLLAQASEIFSSPGQSFGLLTDADMVFPVIEDDKGQKVQLTHSLYGKLLENTDRRVRRDVFESFYSVFDQFKNTLASLFSTEIKKNNYLAKAKKFHSAREAALYENNIPEVVYDHLVATVNKNLPLLHRYVALRKQLLQIDDLQMYDMYTPMLGDAPISFTYEEAKKITLEALAPMGEEYQAILKESFDEGWIDLCENVGKRSGAYSSGSYDSKPYILLNWQDTINWLYTLVHELGHSVHSYYTRKHQPYHYGDYSIFLAEIASTTNENLLTHYLLQKYQEPKIRQYILNHFLDGVKGTLFRQTQFAEFENFVHEADAKGIPLTQEYLSDNYQELNQKYYGPAVNSDSEIRLEWSRIPHFYYNYYVYQYATGFSAALAFANKIVAGDQEALERYLNFLKSGSSAYPVEIMQKAGVDMTQADYIQTALDTFEWRLNEFEALLED